MNSWKRSSDVVVGRAKTYADRTGCSDRAKWISRVAPVPFSRVRGPPDIIDAGASGRGCFREPSCSHRLESVSLGCFTTDPARTFADIATTLNGFPTNPRAKSPKTSGGIVGSVVTCRPVGRNQTGPVEANSPRGTVLSCHDGRSGLVNDIPELYRIGSDRGWPGPVGSTAGRPRT